MSVSTQQDQQIKSAHRRLWALGDYPAVAREVIAELGRATVAAAEIRQGERVIDIAAGSGNSAIPAAAAGGVVTATDLTPELFEVGRRDAQAAGVELSWEQADAERLPYADDSFDVALSSVGIMFAPFHERSAAELTRVVRPGGRIALTNWTPAGFIGRMFAVMKPYAPPPPPGASPGPLWGDPEHVAGLLGERVEGLSAEHRVLVVERFATALQFLDFFKSHYGPTIAVYTRISDDPTAVGDLDQALLDLAGEYFRPDDAAMEWEYLLTTATVR